MSARGFVHLHTHSHYSLLEALPKISDLIDAAKKDGMTALALTDNGNLYGAIEFYKDAKKAGIKPIIGVDFFVAPRTRNDKEHKIDDQLGRLVLLAKNETGYKNLIKLVSRSYLEGFYVRPRIDRELIEELHEGLIAILPSHAGESAYALRHGQADRASQSFEWHRKIFGDDCYQEITIHPEIPGHAQEMNALIALANECKVPIVAAHDVYYLDPDDGLACDLVNKIRTGGTLDRENGEYRMRDFSFLSSKKIEELFAALPDAIENAHKIADACNVELHLGSWVFPDFKIPESTSYDAELRTLCFAGFEKRGVEKSPQVLERVEYELSVIQKKGYAPYFLVVSDLLRHAKETGILTNIRGSVAGSMVTYLSGITNVNPLEYQLPFERFLNPERPSAPDIDMDYADDRRDEMIDYVRGKYGEDHVAQIGTFGTMLARAAVRDVARALGHPYSLGDTIAKLIPFPKQGFPVFIKHSIDTIPELRAVYENDPDAHEILDLAQKIEGNARHVGVHAAGVVIAPTPVTDFTPIQLDPKGGKIISQYDMHAVEDAGLLKFDFLGLTNLSILADALKRVKDRLGVTIDIDGFPLDDKKTFDMLARGETLGVFQLAGGGMTAYLVDLKPTVIHDINAMVALYRPGPMAFIPDYIARKKNPKLVKYLDPRMEHILKNSYGVITYQDDVLQIAIDLAGYSWLEADKFRKAMGKKIPEEMASQKEKFQKGCLERGMKPEVVKKLWEQIETFAAYGFNKAHAASYGNLAYKTAYMKANYPVDYMAALLTADAGEVEKIADIVAECKRMGIEVLPPSVNESRGTFTVIDETHIRFGLYSIKNFGTGVADSIIVAREKEGHFKDIGDFLARVADKNLNKKSLESLIQSGALDELGERGQLLANIELLLSYHREHVSAPTDQGSLFGALPVSTTLKLPPAREAELDQKLVWEKELLGLYISGHPLDKHKHKLQNSKNTIKHAKEHLRGIETVIAGFLETAETKLTKNGERMLFARISDFSDGIELIAFPRVLKEFEKIFAAGACIAIKGKISERNGEASFVVEKAKAL
ncbi:MAG TPA: DNA polymerase III subunit alpha [Candidatus Paceibacterota bacterium]|nr:DNA polymerase III subunit alpha [Candidatus Paceibacterota bacterium]